MDGMNEECKPVTVTGEDGVQFTAFVHGDVEDWTQEDVDMFGELIRAAQRKHRREHPELCAEETR